MIDDLVIDTNVLVHASNPAVPRHEAALLFATSLLAADTLLCLDEGFSAIEAQNRSLIGGEYYQHLVVGMIGYAVVATLAASERVKQVSKTVPAAARTRIKRLIPRNPRDRTFVQVAVNSTDNVLVSHDFDDLGDDVRRKLRAEVGIDVDTAEQALLRLVDNPAG